MDASMKCRNLIAALICICFYSIFAFAESSCDVVTYGTPDVKDCFDLLQQLPGGFTSQEIDVNAIRSFVEPKFLRPAFVPIYNPYTTEMVQLPKIWKKNSCCVALLSIATPGGIVQEPTSVDKWQTVLNAFIDTVEVCIVRGIGKGSGGMHFANTVKPDAKVVYVYERTSPFEKAINRYMSSYQQGLNPNNPNAVFVASPPLNSLVSETAPASS